MKDFLLSWLVLWAVLLAIFLAYGQARGQSYADDPSPFVERLKHGAGHSAVSSTVTLAAHWGLGLNELDATLVGTVAYPLLFEGVAEWARWGVPLWENRDGWFDILEAQGPWAFYLAKRKKWVPAAIVFAGVSGLIVYRAARPGCCR